MASPEGLEQRRRLNALARRLGIRSIGESQSAVHRLQALLNEYLEAAPELVEVERQRAEDEMCLDVEADGRMN
jgi:hypothetical protein